VHVSPEIKGPYADTEHTSARERMTRMVYTLPR